MWAAVEGEKAGGGRLVVSGNRQSSEAFLVTWIVEGRIRPRSWMLSSMRSLGVEISDIAESLATVAAVVEGTIQRGRCLGTCSSVGSA